MIFCHVFQFFTIQLTTKVIQRHLYWIIKFTNASLLYCMLKFRYFTRTRCFILLLVFHTKNTWCGCVVHSAFTIWEDRNCIANGMEDHRYLKSSLNKMVMKWFTDAWHHRILPGKKVGINFLISERDVASTFVSVYCYGLVLWSKWMTLNWWDGQLKEA